MSYSRNKLLSRLFADISYADRMNDPKALNAVIYAINEESVRSQVQRICQSFHAMQKLDSRDLEDVCERIFIQEALLNKAQVEAVHLKYVTLFSPDVQSELGRMDDTAAYFLRLERICAGQVNDLSVFQKAYWAVLMLNDYARIFSAGTMVSEFDALEPSNDDFVMHEIDVDQEIADLKEELGL